MCRTDLCYVNIHVFYLYHNTIYNDVYDMLYIVRKSIRAEGKF